jgi:hypothetical protein
MSTSRPAAATPPAAELCFSYKTVKNEAAEPEADQAAARTLGPYYWIDLCRAALGIQPSGHAQSTIDEVNREDGPGARS